MFKDQLIERAEGCGRGSAVGKIQSTAEEGARALRKGTQKLKSYGEVGWGILKQKQCWCTIHGKGQLESVTRDEGKETQEKATSRSRERDRKKLPSRRAS